MRVSSTNFFLNCINVNVTIVVFFQGRVCSCQFQCSELTYEEIMQHFTNFYKLDYNNQSQFLANSCIMVGEVKRRRASEDVSQRHCTAEYYIPRKDRLLRVCRKTLCNVFTITPRRVQWLVGKIKFDQPLTDDRGTHKNRPHKVKDDTKELVKQHIQSFPLQENHYSRNNSKKQCLDPNLSVKKMWQLFRIKHPEANVSLHMYRNIFISDFNLRFGLPRSDTCAYCDRLFINLVAAPNETERQTIERESQIHHMKAELAYKSLAEDTAVAKATPNIVAICVDLEQVLFCPLLTHNNIFYQRQLSCYNVAIHNLGLNKATMFFWDETIGKRGSAEITSCVLKYVSANFRTLTIGETRTLVIWSDRCVGQNNNWRMVALMQHLIQNEYFTTVEQKFLTTGHSFLPCDRDFAMIEKAKKGAKVYIPFHWVSVIANAKESNGFEIQVMETDDFKNSDIVLNSLATATFSITQHVWYQITKDDPATLRARPSHNVLRPWTTHCLAKKVRYSRDGSVYPPVKIAEFPNLYPGRLGIMAAKKTDLLDMMRYIPQEFRAFYENITVA